MSTDYELEKKQIEDYLNEELAKPAKKRDYILIHECYLALSESFDYEYKNEYKRLAIQQETLRKLTHKMRNKLMNKAAMF